jgi:parvulin-like peptidyl-prolyl isomerase
LAQLEASEDPAVYYEFLFSQLEAARELDRLTFQNQLELPDFEALALERYKISKNDIASVPEIREASHILLLCTEDCDDEDETVAALTSIRQRIIQGESFSDLAIEFSQDPGSKTRGGRLSKGIASDAESVDQSVKDALFTMSQVGDISDIVRSRFGFHILKLESVTPARERSFEEVAVALKKEIEKRFRQDAYREYILSLAPKDEVEIDIEAFESLADSI